jgi:hypothetical protein
MSFNQISIAVAVTGRNSRGRWQVALQYIYRRICIYKGVEAGKIGND